MNDLSRRDMLKATAGAGLSVCSSSLVGCSTPPSGAEPVTLRVLCGPTPVGQMGKTVYGYELHIGRALSLGLTVSRVEILAGGVVVKTYEGAELADCLIEGVDPFSPEDAIFNGRDYLVLFAWPEMDLTAPIVSRFSHRVHFADGLVIEGGTVAVKTGTTLIRPPVIAPPVPNDDLFWWAIGGPSNSDESHRKSFFDLRFKRTISQRFAVDWVLINRNDGRQFTGTGQTCAEYFCYGADLLAVADGTVIEARDGLPDVVPGAEYSPTYQNVFGNSIVLDIGGRYAVYAHVKPGTVAVKVGDSVSTGQVIGKLGSSGFSTAPHLHFHLCDGRDALGSEGLPFSFARYDLLGSVKDPQLGPLRTRTDEMPVTNQIVKLY